MAEETYPCETIMREDRFGELTRESFFPDCDPDTRASLAESVLEIPKGANGKVFMWMAGGGRVCPLCSIGRPGRTGPKVIRPWVNPHIPPTVKKIPGVIRACRTDLLAKPIHRTTRDVFAWFLEQPEEIRYFRQYLPDTSSTYSWSVVYADGAIFIHGGFGRVCWFFSTDDIDFKYAFGFKPSPSWFMDKLRDNHHGIGLDPFFQVQEVETGEFP